MFCHKTWRNACSDCDCLSLALVAAGPGPGTPHLWPLALLLEPGALHACALLGLFWVPFALSIVLGTTDAPARKSIKSRKEE